MKPFTTVFWILVKLIKYSPVLNSFFRGHLANVDGGVSLMSFLPKGDLGKKEKLLKNKCSLHQKKKNQKEDS
jgi:hypothetical protein